MFKQAPCNESDKMSSHDSEAKAKNLKIIFWLILLLAGGTFLADVLVRHWQIMQLQKDVKAAISDVIYTLEQMYENGWRIRKDETKAAQ